MEVIGMAFTVKITYKGVETDASRIVASISPIFVPTNSYIDTPAYVEGFHNSVTGGTIADKYGKSIYANNVDDKWGYAAQVAPYDSTSIPFPVPLAQFKLAIVGENNTVTFTVDDYKEAFYYKELGHQLADQGFEVEVTDAEPEKKTKDAVTDQDIIDAANDPDISILNITAPITQSAEVQFNKPMTIDGGNQVVTQTTTGKTFTMMQDSTLNNVVINSTADNTAWHSSYGIQLYPGKHTINNATLSGGNAGIIVKGATATLSGTIDVSNNTFGGIEVSKGTASGLTAGILNINGATLVNTTEEYGKPTVWIGGTTDAEGIVNGADKLTRVEVDKGSKKQIHFYLDSKNAKAPEVSKTAKTTKEASK